MDSKGRALDNGLELEKGLNGFIQFYNYERKHKSLGYLTPAQVYIDKKELSKKSGVPPSTKT